MTAEAKMTIKSAKIPKGFSAWVYNEAQERNRKREIVLSVGRDPMTKKNRQEKGQSRAMTQQNKFDHLNGDQLRPEYIAELEETRKDIHDHNVEISEGFQTWLDGAMDRQKKARLDLAEQTRERMFPEKRTELSELDQALHDQGELTNYNLRKKEGKDHFRDLLFPPKETEKRRSQIENGRHPMDVLIRKQLEERRK